MPHGYWMCMRVPNAVYAGSPKPGNAWRADNHGRPSGTQWRRHGYRGARCSYVAPSGVECCGAAGGGDGCSPMARPRPAIGTKVVGFFSVRNPLGEVVRRGILELSRPVPSRLTGSSVGSSDCAVGA